MCFGAFLSKEASQFEEQLRDLARGRDSAVTVDGVEHKLTSGSFFALTHKAVHVGICAEERLIEPGALRERDPFGFTL